MGWLREDVKHPLCAFGSSGYDGRHALPCHHTFLRRTKPPSYSRMIGSHGAQLLALPAMPALPCHWPMGPSRLSFPVSLHMPLAISKPKPPR